MGLRHLLGRGVPLPSWLNDQTPAGPSWGFRVLFGGALLVDAQLEVMLQAALAAVGRGTPTALPIVGRARGIERGRLDTDATYGAKLRTWVDRHKERGSQRRLAREIAEFLGESRVRVVNRSGHWVTVDADGTLAETTAAWDWDSVSHPERAGYLSEQWIIVYSPPAWVARPNTLGDLTGGDGYALGHMVPIPDVDVLTRMVNFWKSGHSLVRAVIWTTDATRFDPATPATCPDGTWGAWSMNVAGSQVPSGRDLTTCRYWEPR